ncbi:MAG: CBS domain-containing protein [Ruminococcaceae bacterium]|nr:CBS domain-containing protein [Oscillospiraceae bacterium]
MNILMLLKPKSEVQYLLDTWTIRQGLEKMRAHGYAAIPVLTKDGLYVGCVSEGDFLWHLVDRTGQIDSIRKCENYRIREIIKPERNPAVTVDVDMETVLERSMHQNFIPVTDDYGAFIGIVTRQDIIRRFCTVERKNTVSAVGRIYSS